MREQVSLERLRSFRERLQMNRWHVRGENHDAAVTGGSAVLFSTHQSEETPQACRRSVTIENGRIASA